MYKLVIYTYCRTVTTLVPNNQRACDCITLNVNSSSYYVIFRGTVTGLGPKYKKNENPVA